MTSKTKGIRKHYATIILIILGLCYTTALGFILSWAPENKDEASNFSTLLMVSVHALLIFWNYGKFIYRKILVQFLSFSWIYFNAEQIIANSFSIYLCIIGFLVISVITFLVFNYRK